MTPGTKIDRTGLTYEELAMAVNEAASSDVRVCAHSIGTTGIKNALRAGVASIEHGSFLDDEALELLLEKDTYHIPTLSAYYQAVANCEEAGFAPDAVQKAKCADNSNTNSFSRSFKSGVKVAMGTDAGMPFNPAWWNRP